MAKPKNESSEKEIEQRRDAILKRMHKLPPKPNKDYVGDSKKKDKPQRPKK